MTRYLSAAVIVALNAEHGGAGAGVVDLGGVESAVARPQASFAGHERYSTVWDKAGALLHGLCSTQYFMDGNKRTAWLAAELFLRLNGSPLRDVPVVAQEAFVLSVSTNLLSVERAGEWFQSNRVTAADRLACVHLATTVEQSDEHSAIINATRMGTTDFQCFDPVVFGPSVFAAVVISRWTMVPADMGRTFLFEVSIATDNADVPAPYEFHPLQGTTSDLTAGRFMAGPDDWPTSILNMFDVVLVAQALGDAHIVLCLDGEEAGRLPLGVTERMGPVPDHV